MRYSLNQIKKIVLEANLAVNPKVSFLAEGFGNCNYLIEDAHQKLVFRIKKSHETQFQDSLEREYVYLKFFQNQGISFCPKVVCYHPEINYLVELFIEGEEICNKDLSNIQIDMFAHQLYQLFSLKVSDFIQFCKNHNLRVFNYQNPIQSLEQYGFNRFNLFKKADIDSRVISWIAHRLDQNLKYLLTLENPQYCLGFCWGDIQSSVIIDRFNKMFFFDFEHVHVSNSPGLGYVKVHGQFDDIQFDYLLDRYSHYSKRSKERLIDEINHSLKITRVNDVVWAAMKWAETQKEEFMQLTFDRIKLVDDSFSKL